MQTCSHAVSTPFIYKPGHNISYKIACGPSDDSFCAFTRSLIRRFAGQFVGSQGSKASSGGQRRL